MRELLLAIDAEDWQRLGAMLSPDCHYLAPGMRMLRGREEILDYYQRKRPIAAGVHVIERSCALPGEAIAIGTFTGTTRAGKKTALHFTDWVKFQGNLISAREVFVKPRKT
ncbi:MAG: nuclear transport factor 2 family protein [Gammaproteobacteria bacterium]|nr:nuclear transport factor 2 family protein [Gammaproteobacteria bacterium]